MCSPSSRLALPESSLYKLRKRYNLSKIVSLRKFSSAPAFVYPHCMNWLRRLLGQRPAWIPADWPHGPWDDEEQDDLVNIDVLDIHSTLRRQMANGAWAGTVTVPPLHPWAAIRSWQDAQAEIPVSLPFHAITPLSDGSLRLLFRYDDLDHAVPKYGLRPGKRYVTFKEAESDMRRLVHAAYAAVHRPEWMQSEWPDGPWNYEPGWREEFQASGYPCDLRRSHAGFWAGYVSLPASHPWSDHPDDLHGVRVHGGITYSGLSGMKFKVGFDAGHVLDATPADGFLHQGSTYRTRAFMREQCRSLAKQARRAAEGGSWRR